MPVRPPRIAFYGDDFTGSTDAMECLALAGLRTVLFVREPDEAALRRHGALDAIGIAGDSRMMTPAEMDAAMPRALASLRASGAGIVHYKTCSTFDSAPSVGSIGHVMDLAREAGWRGPIPIVVGAPALGRYCAFGTLFARDNVDGTVHRLDRHPTMRAHPITPMDEADLRLHLARQTRQRVALFSYLDTAGDASAVRERLGAVLQARPGAVLFDVVDPAHQARVGQLVAGMADGDAPLLTVGSSGVEYALVAWWLESGALPTPPPPRWPDPVDQLLVVSGSCSPVTSGQIAAARQAGFAEIALDPVPLIEGGDGGSAARAVATRAGDLLRQGRSVVVHSCAGPDDPRRGATAAHLRRRGLDDQAAALQGGRALAEALGGLLRAILADAPVRRVVIAGGDTSSRSVRLLGVEALEMIAPLVPGSPLCRVIAPGQAIDGTEIVLKGGQVGPPGFFEAVRSADGGRGCG